MPQEYFCVLEILDHLSSMSHHKVDGFFLVHQRRWMLFDLLLIVNPKRLSQEVDFIYFSHCKTRAFIFNLTLGKMKIFCLQFSYFWFPRELRVMSRLATLICVDANKNASEVFDLLIMLMGIIILPLWPIHHHLTTNNKNALLKSVPDDCRKLEHLGVVSIVRLSLHFKIIMSSEHHL